MNENLSLGRIAGIHVGLNWSLLVIGALIAWSLATGILPSAAPGQTSGAYWTAGVVSAFVYLASLLAHELAHSIGPCDAASESRASRCGCLAACHGSAAKPARPVRKR